MAGELAEEEFCPHRPKPVKKGGQFERHDSVNAEHLDWLRIVAVQHRAAIARPPPQTLLTERCLPIVEIQTDVGVQKLELTDRRYG